MRERERGRPTHGKAHELDEHERQREQEQARRLLEVDAVHGGHADLCHALARREALDELAHARVERVEAGRTDRLEEVAALAPASDDEGASATE